MHSVRSRRPSVAFVPKLLRFLIYGIFSILLIALFVGAECSSSVDSKSSEGPHADDDDTDEDELDDCGYKMTTVPDGCDKCHGAYPVTVRHPRNHRCYRCHGYVVNEDFEFVQAALHNNGVVDVAVGCMSCHGWKDGTSPPQNLKGECGQDKKGVGSHKAMRRAAVPAHRVGCPNCHNVPTETWQEGHIDGDHRAEVTFGKLATLEGAEPKWDGTKCTNVYCHGATLNGGSHKNPVWGDSTGVFSKCGACHVIADPNGETDSDCSICHPTSVDSDRSILPRGTHINGHIDMAVEKKGGRK